VKLYNTVTVTIRSNQTSALHTDNKLCTRNSCGIYEVHSTRITFGTVTCVDQHGVIGIATCYSLDSPGIESWWGWEYLHLSRPVLGPTQPAVQWVPGLFPRPRQLGHGVDHPPPYAMEVKERVELYLYIPSGPLWPILGWHYLYLTVRWSSSKMYFPKFSF
jgi:hypothetical protein